MELVGYITENSWSQLERLTELGGVPSWQVFDQSHRVFRHLQGLPLDQLLQTSHHSPPQAQEGAAQVGLQHTRAFTRGLL